ncbi:MAG: tetratricopeptide repeat protein [Puniceicoccales bacterium]
MIPIPPLRHCCWPIAVLTVLLTLTGCGKGGSNATDHSPEAQVNAGVEALRVFDFDTAYERLGEIQPSLDQDDPNWVLATYSLGIAAWHLTPPSEIAINEAVEYLSAVVEAAPESDFAASALLDLGRIAEVKNYRNDNTDVPAAQAYYRQVREEFPQTEMSARATLYLAQTLVQTFDEASIREAVKLLEVEMAAQPDSPWLGVMAQYTAQIEAFYLHDPASALTHYQLAKDTGFPRPADADMSLWQFGLLAEEAGEPLIAAENFSIIVREYPRSFYGTVARERVKAIADANPEANITVPEPPDLGLGRE